jgi:hypothetical protein
MKIANINKLRKKQLFWSKFTKKSETRLTSIDDGLAWVKVLIAILVLSLVIFIAVSNACGEITLSHQDADHYHYVLERFEKR